MKKKLINILATILILFGLLTLFLSTSVIFDLFGMRAKEGNFVLFVVWSNFISSILYLLAAYGLLTNKKWPIIPLGFSTLILIGGYFGLKMHIEAGGLYETKTVTAMLFRTSITFLFTVAAYLLITKNEK